MCAVCLSPDALAIEGGRCLSGVFSSGYGIVPKHIMMDSSLSPEARLIYAYYCVIKRGRGDVRTLAPYESTILTDLGMSHSMFSMRRKELISRHLLFLDQNLTASPKHPFGRSRFLVANDTEDMLSDGYGLCPRQVLTDAELSRNAKSVYVCLCSLATASTAEDRVVYGLTMDILACAIMPTKRLRASLSELRGRGYLLSCRTHTALQTHVLVNDVGAARHNTNVPIHTGQIHTTQRKTVQPDTAQTALTLRITSSDITKLPNTSPSIPSGVAMKENVENGIGCVDTWDSVNDQIEGDILAVEHGEGIINACISCLLSAYSSTDEYVTIGKHRMYRASVISVLRRIKPQHVEAVIFSICGHASILDVVNFPAYLLTCLYNSVVMVGVQDAFSASCSEF